MLQVLPTCAHLVQPEGASLAANTLPDRTSARGAQNDTEFH